MTLTEVIVVLAILGILILLTAFSLRPVVLLGRARDSRRRADLKKIATSLEDYNGDHNCYPLSTSWEEEVRYYSPQVPKDPLTKLPYSYSCQADCNNATGCTKYLMIANLEIDEGANYGQGKYAVASSNNRIVVPTPSPTGFVVGLPPPGGPTATSTPAVAPSGNFWACFSGVCKPIASQSVCPGMNYQMNDCASQCSNPANECR